VAGQAVGDLAEMVGKSNRAAELVQVAGMGGVTDWMRSSRLGGVNQAATWLGR
jgi:hypothetical protein